MLAFYLNAFTVLVYMPSILCTLLGWTPLEADGAGYLLHMLPLVAATEMWLLVVNHPYNDRRRRQRRRFRSLCDTRHSRSGALRCFARVSVSSPDEQPADVRHASRPGLTRQGAAGRVALSDRREQEVLHETLRSRRRGSGGARIGPCVRAW